MKAFFLGLIKIVVPLYILVCGLLYYFQERLMFFPERLPKDFQFRFEQEFEEIFLSTEDGVSLHGLLFRAENPKGLVFYLHGNAGSVRSWGEVAPLFNELDQDVFILDYRGYGKSEGRINSQEQLFSDVQLAYDWARSHYGEGDISILGYSIGTGPATKLAADNNAKMLILQAPFYDMGTVVKQHFPIFPVFLLKYHFKNHKHLDSVDYPVVIFHGREDEIIGHQSAIRLKEGFKGDRKLILLEGQGHNGMTGHPEYIREISSLFQK